MALIVDQQADFKHFCKICKKGFGCGRALGGHMRAHGIGDESGHPDDEDPASDWEDKLGGGGADVVPPNNNKRMYALRTNPNRFKSCRVCENCGKEFLSWKSFLEHGKCSSEDAESLVSSPGSEDAEETRRGCGWSKRKRSLRAKVGYFNSNCPSSEEEDLANCLMMLSNAAVDPLVAAEPEESCASASKEGERRNPMNFIAPNTMACRAAPTENKAKGVANKGLFECKACKKVFNSHQALGGHRASHKKVKGCFAARLDQGLDDNSVAEEDAITNEEFFPTKSTIQFDRVSNYAQLGSASKRRSKVHECSICHRVFSSGQALGGHKRCHWITSNSPPDASSLDKLNQLQDHMEQIQQRPKFINITHETFDLTLDLNLPAPADDHAGEKRDHNNPGNPASLDISTEIYLQSWAGVDAKEKDDNRYQDNENDEDNEKNNKDNNNNNKNNNNVVNNNNNCVSSVQNVDDEADSKAQLAKLSELKDMNVNGNSSPWLQVGIGSTAGVAADPQLN